MKKVTFELPDSEAAISMAIVTSNLFGISLVTKSYAEKELEDGVVNEWVEPKCREGEIC